MPGTKVEISLENLVHLVENLSIRVNLMSETSEISIENQIYNLKMCSRYFPKYIRETRTDIFLNAKKIILLLPLSAYSTKIWINIATH